MVSDRTATTVSSASTIWLARALAMRKSSEGTPSKGWTTATRLKSTRAVGRANLVKTSPVVTARPARPSITCTSESRLAAVPRGSLSP